MRRRGRLARKYLVILVGLVTGALLVSGAIEIYYSYNENKAALVTLQREKASGAASRIETFVREIERQLVWTTQPLLVPTPAAAIEQRRIDAVRLQRQVLPITEVSHLDASGREQLRVSRLAMDVVGSQTDFSGDPKFRVAKSGRTYFGPVYFRKESEPYMTIAMPQAGGGVTVAEVNLKFIWDVVSQIRVGKAGLAYVVDGGGALIAHPDISLVLQKTSLASLDQVKTVLAGVPGASEVTIARDLKGKEVLTAHSVITTLGWVVFVEQPLEEAFQALRSSAYRTALLVALGIGLAAMASVVLARRLAQPIQALQVSAAKIGAGELDHQITIKTGDELEALADEFNEMTGRLRESHATLEQRVEDRTRELTETLEQQTATAEILRVISSSPTDIQPVMKAVAEAASRLTDASRALIGQVEGDGFVWRASSEGRLITDRRFPITRELPSGRAILDRQTTQEADLARLVGEWPHLVDVTQVAHVRTALATPLLREGAAIGVLLVYRTEIRPFTDKQITLLQTFADQAVIAIENVRLFKELEEKNRVVTAALEQQTATAEILRVISSSPTDVQPVLDAVAENATRVCEAGDGAVLLIRDGAFRIAAHHGSISMPFDEPIPIVPGTVAGRAVLDGGPVHVPDLIGAAGDFPEGQAIAARFGNRTTLATPLMREGTAIGALLIRRTDVRPFTDKQVALLKTFADQAVIAIENVRLFQELQSRTAELTRSVGELEALGEVGRAISSTLDLETVLATIVARATELAEGDGGVLYEFDEASRAFHLRATDRFPEEFVAALRATRLVYGEGAAGRAVATREPIQVADVTDTDAYSSRVREVLSLAAGRPARQRGRGSRRARHQPPDPRRLHGPHGRAAAHLRQPVGAGHPERAALPPDRGQEPGAGDRRPSQGRVPGQHVARAAHAAQRDHRILGGDDRADVRRRERQAGGVPERHPVLGAPPALAHQRYPRPRQDRGGPDGAGAGRLPPALGHRQRARAHPRAGAAAGHRAGAVDRSPAGRDQGRRAQGQAGPAQSAVECRQVHAGGRPYRRPGPAHQRGRRDLGGRHRGRHRPRGPRRGVRRVPAGGHRLRTQARGHRPRPGAGP